MRHRRRRLARARRRFAGVLVGVAKSWGAARAIADEARAAFPEFVVSVSDTRDHHRWMITRGHHTHPTAVTSWPAIKRLAVVSPSPVRPS